MALGQEDNEALLRIDSDVERALTDLQRIREGLAGLGDQSQKTQRQVQGFGQATQRAFSESLTGVVLGTRRATDALGGFAASLTRTFLTTLGTTGTAVAGLGVVLVGAGAIALRTARHFADYAEQLKNAAVQAGVSIEFYQRVQRVLVATGLGAESANLALRFFARSVDAAAQGGGDAALIFQQLRIGVRDIAGEVRPLNELLNEFIAALVGVSRANEQAAIAARIFGRQGQVLLPFFREWAAAQSDATKRAESLAGVLSQQSVEAALRFNTQWTRMSTALQDAKNLMGAAATVASGPLMRGLRGLAESARDAATWVALMTGAIDDLPRATDVATRGVIDLTNEQKKRAVEGIQAVKDAEAAVATARARRRGDEQQALQTEYQARIDAITIERELVLNTTTAVGEELTSIVKNYDRKLEAENLAHKKNLENADAEAAQRRSLLQIAAERKALDDLTAIDAAGLRVMQAQRRISDEEALDQQTEFELQRLAHQRQAAQKELDLETTTFQRRRELLPELEAIERQKSVITAKAEAERADIRARAIEAERDLQVLVAQAFGTETQQRVQALVREHDEWIERLKTLGRSDLVPDVTAAYQRMISDVRGVVVDLNATVQRGISDAFSGVILGTRTGADIGRAFRESMVSQFSQAFSEVLLKKAGFDLKLRLNATQEIPAIAAEGAEGFARPFDAVFNLLGGGTGVSRGVAVSPAGIASFVGGPAGPTRVVGAVPGITAPGVAIGEAAIQLGTMAGPPAPIVTAAGGATLPASSMLQTVGGSVATLGTGALLLSALSGGGGPLGPIGPLATLTALGGFVPGVAGTLGLSGLTGLGGLTNLGALTGTATPAIAGSALSSIAAAVPYIAAAIAVISGAASATQFALAAGKRPYGAAGPAGAGAGVTGEDLQFAFFSGVLGKGIAKALRPIFGPLYKLSVKLMGGFDVTKEFFEFIGLLHTPLPHTTAHRIFNELDKQQFFRDIQAEFSPLGPHRLPWESEEWARETGRPDLMAKTPAYAGPARYETFRPLLEAAGAVTLARAPASSRGPFTAASVHEFASSFIRDAEQTGMAVDAFKGEIDAMVKALGGTLPSAIVLLNQLFDPAKFAQSPEVRGLYADAVAELTAAFIEGLPNVAKEVIRDIAQAGKVSIDELTDFVNATMAGVDVARNALRAMVEAAVPETDAARQERERETEARQIDFEVAQAQSAARVEYLRDQVAQAHILGQTIRESELEMELASELAAQDAARRQKELQETVATITPHAAFVQALKDGLRSAVVDAIVEGLLQAGAIQVALAPFFAQLEAFGKVLSDPSATTEQIDAAFGDLQASLDTAGPQLARLWTYYKKLMDLPSMQQILGGDWLSEETAPGAGYPSGMPYYSAPGVNVGQKVPGIDLAKVSYPVPSFFDASVLAMQAGGVVTRPTLALLGEAGPEMVTPLGRGGAPIHLTVNLTGNYILNEHDADRLGRVVGDSMMRRVKQQRLFG